VLGGPRSCSIQSVGRFLQVLVETTIGHWKWGFDVFGGGPETHMTLHFISFISLAKGCLWDVPSHSYLDCGRG
jgi:hypothetical protein